ncbi:hypothetical protein ILUMI_01672 [Ignelater luminosus]|uniref:Peptidase S1 domain-containing protein n=1 Tax=Ignelater luminosus TaxID=2038154 RepID=A0A8K0DI14_IGNLU|nr:hypothetical protein ILUMI_01672 [Ignelater luminosus]
MKFSLFNLYLVYILVSSVKSKVPKPKPARLGFFRETLRPEVRVIGGLKAERHQFPYQVSLQYNGVHICGGVLISETRVITAAHCKVRINALYEVVLGMLILYEDHEDIQRRMVENFTIHPEFPLFSRYIATDDIAVLDLSEPVKLTPAVQVIKLPTQKQCNAMGSMVISGWGYSNPEANQHSSTLRWAALPRITYKQCRQDLLAVARTSKPLDKTMICTSSVVGKNQSACSGDSGGPLVYDGAVVGIVSWGVIPCGTRHAPTVYIKPCSHESFLRSDSCSCLILNHGKSRLILSYLLYIFYINDLCS